MNPGKKGKVVGRLELTPAGAQPLTPIALGPEWADDTSTRSLMTRYLSRVNKEELLARVPRLPEPDGRRFAGTAACASYGPVPCSKTAEGRHAPGRPRPAAERGRQPRV